jgi:AAHS family 4-hydroxybenzoate transporter-like MFS transporter
MPPQKIDLAKLLDEGRWSPWQKLLVAGTALAIILDGLDNTVLPTAIRALSDDWHLKRADFSTALMMSPLGMLVGGLIGGWLGDRLGRRLILLGSIVAFALPTAAVYFAPNLAVLAALRFLAGLGLGGAMPNATALASEYVPRRQRPFAVTLAIVCVPLGAMLASFLAARMIPAYGWRMFFLVCGLVPLALGAGLAPVLGESPRFLARRRERWPELVALLRRFGHSVPADAEFAEAEAPRSGPAADGAKGPFSPDYRRDTVSLCCAFFFCLLTVYLGLQLLPTVLSGKAAGFTLAEANDIFTWFNVGGVVGALIGSQVIQRLGSRQPMLSLCASAVAGALVSAVLPLDTGHRALVVATCAFLGVTINAVQVALFALAAHVYPTEIRGRGVGTVLAIGRVGNVLAPSAGLYVLGPDQNRVALYFATFGVGMVAVLAALLGVRRHIVRGGVDTAAR